MSEIYSFQLLSMHEFAYHPEWDKLLRIWVYAIFADQFHSCILCDTKIGPMYDAPGAVAVLQAISGEIDGALASICHACVRDYDPKDIFDRAYKFISEQVGVVEVRRLDTVHGAGHA